MINELGYSSCIPREKIKKKYREAARSKFKFNCRFHPKRNNKKPPKVKDKNILFTREKGEGQGAAAAHILDHDCFEPGLYQVHQG